MPSPVRIAAALALWAAGLLVAWIEDAPLIGLAALAAGGAGVALLSRRSETPRASQPRVRAPESVGSPALPAAPELIEAVEEPLMLVRARKVLLANRAAKSLLGSHIEGVDVRLAIRHPAAAAQLAQPDGSGASTELAGIGGVERRWTMETAPVGDGSLLVRLTDRSEAHASEQMRTDFVANASHELRTPLTTLLGFLETLQDEEAGSDPKLRARFLGIMFDEAKRMHRLVDDLISLSRVEAERFSVPREPVRLLPIVEEVRSGCAQLIEARRSEILVEGGGIDPVVPGERAQLAQLVQNLVVNGLKYGREGSPVTIRFAEAEGGMLRMSVIDRGEGIAPEHLPRLTERFYRVDPGRSRAMGGTGLGLAIVKHIVGRHRGRIEIESVQGRGTSVHILLPRA